MPKRWFPTRRAMRSLAGAALAVAGLGLLAAALFGPGAAPLVDLLADGRKVWRLGRIEVDGVSGPNLGSLRAEEIRLRDENGVWARARGFELRWSPLALLGGDLEVARAAVERVEVLRRPVLAAPGPDGGALDVTVESLAVDRLLLAAGVATADAAIFALDGAIAIDDQQLARAELDLARTDGGGDRLVLAFTGDPLVLDATLEGPEGGAFAALAGAAVEAQANADGERLQATASVGGAEAFSARGTWSEDRWALSAQARLAAVPALEALAARLGPTLAFEAEGGRPRERAQTFTASVSAERLSLSAQGRLAPGLALREPIGVKLSAPGALAGLAGGRFAFDGEIDRQPKATRVDGAVTLEGLAAADAALTGTGRVAARITAERVIVEARFAGDVEGSPIAQRLLRGLTAEADAEYLRGAGALRIREAAIGGPAFSLTAKGGPVAGGGWRVNGGFRLAEPAALVEGLRGAVSGDWRLEQEGDTGPWTLVADGRARNLRGGPEALGDLVGRTADLQARLTFDETGIGIPLATLTARRLRLGARGRIVDGSADLRLEGSARGPVGFGAVELTGAADVTGSLQGPLDALRLDAEARLAALDLAGASLRDARIGLRLVPAGAGRAGRLTAQGLLAGRSAEVAGRLRVSESAVALSDLVARYASLAASGEVRIGLAGPTADLTFAGPLAGLEIAGVSGDLRGALALAPGPRGAPARLEASVAVTGATLPAGVTLARADLAAAGPLDALRVQAAVAGASQAEAPFAATVVGSAAVLEGIRARLTLTGEIAETPFAATAPLVLELADGETLVEAALSIGAGAATLRYRSGAAGDDVLATLTRTPVAPFAALAGETAEGSVTGELAADLQGELTGRATAALEDFRLPRRSPETIDAEIEATLTPRALIAEIAARGGGGLTGDAVLDLPVIASADPLRIARAPSAAARVEWRVAGPIGGLWAIAGPLDQRLTGAVRGEGVALIRPEGFGGSGVLALTGGRFADRATGLTLEALAAELRFDERGVALERLTATDGRGGRISGSGRLGGDGAGEARVRIENFVLVDRQDARARGGGDLAFRFTETGGLLSGELRIAEAEASLPEAQASIPTLEVIEINRPGVAEAEAEAAAPAASASPIGTTRLDVRVVATERVFTRGRGLDAEWALDLRLVGPVDDPALVGQARLIRGSFDLANRRFDLERGVIRFDGGPLEADLDIVAVRETPNLTVRAVITGSPADPEIDLESTPDLPDDEILPQILFGRGASELSAIEAAQLAAGLATLAGRSAFDIAGFARNAIDLDRLDVRQAEGGGLLVSGGRYLTRDVYLEVARGPLGATTTSVEWEVRPRLFLISSFLPEGDQRVAVRWRRNY